MKVFHKLEWQDGKIACVPHVWYNYHVTSVKNLIIMLENL